MRYLFLLSFILLIQFAVQAQDVELDHKVHCDCEHTAGVLDVTTKKEALPPCIELTRELGETDLGGIKIVCNDSSCTCIFTHSVYAFGHDRDSAIVNAVSTCSAVSTLTSRSFEIKSKDECKDEQQ